MNNFSGSKYAALKYERPRLRSCCAKWGFYPLFSFLSALVILFTASFSSGQTGLRYELDIKKRTGMYSDSALSLDQVVIDITKLDPRNDSATQDERIAVMFSRGEQLWFKEGKDQSLLLTMMFGYKNLCNAVIGYYRSTGRLYAVVPYLVKLMNESAERYLVDVEADTISRLTDVYLALGQTEAAKELLMRLQGLIDDYFLVDLKDEDNDAYNILINSVLQKNRIRLAMIDGADDEFLQAEQQFFDFLIKSYGKIYTLPFMQLTGILAGEGAFGIYDPGTIADYLYYTNDDLMYVFAKFFAEHNDRERALTALDWAAKAAMKNGGGDSTSISILKADSTASKEIRAKAGLAVSTEESVLKRVPLRYAYLGSLYRTVVLSKLGDVDEAAKSAADAEQRYAVMAVYYKTLPKEYAYNDKIINSLPELILAEARIAKSRKNFAEADGAYLRLIEHYETVRASMPVALRRGFFRGYAKGAYLGLIENRARMYLAASDRNAFTAFVKAVDMLNARQFRELRGEIPDDSLDSIQASLGSDDLIYMIFDAENSVVTAGITADRIGVNIIPKDSAFERAMYAFKDALVRENVYDMAKLGELTGGIMNPIAGFKKKGNIHAIIDGVVSILPLDIYPVGGQMLFKNYSIDYAVTLRKLQNKKQAVHSLAFLGIADPLYDNKAGEKAAEVKVSPARSADISGYFQSLPETREEVRDISAGMAFFKLLLGPEASESVVKSMPLAKYNIIHFATHGILGGEIPGIDEPALVLSGEKGEDSLLTASEISELQMKARLVVLSACNTGSGRYFRGEGVTGIARAFKVAGTDTVVASLWPVNSMATKSFMEFFYKYITEGQSIPDALYKAKQQLIKEAGRNNGNERGISIHSLKKGGNGYDNPYFWSAFICISS